MYKFQVNVYALYYQIQFWGVDSQEDPVWDDESNFGRSNGAFLFSVAKEDDLTIDINVGGWPEGIHSLYGSGTIDVDENGIEIANVLDSTISGDPGILGMKYKLPWLGRTNISIVGKGDLVSDSEGKEYPSEYEIYLSKA